MNQHVSRMSSLVYTDVNIAKTNYMELEFTGVFTGTRISC